jgi:hypothetical protein
MADTKKSMSVSTRASEAPVLSESSAGLLRELVAHLRQNRPQLREEAPLVEEEGPQAEHELGCHGGRVEEDDQAARLHGQEGKDLQGVIEVPEALALPPRHGSALPESAQQPGDAVVDGQARPG